MRVWIHATVDLPPSQIKDPGSHYTGGSAYNGLYCTFTSFSAYVFIRRTNKIFWTDFIPHLGLIWNLISTSKRTQHYFLPITTQKRCYECDQFEVEHYMIRARSRTKAYRRDSALNRSAVQLHWSGTVGSILFTWARICSRWLLCGGGDT